MTSVRKDLVVVFGDDKDTIISLLRDRTEGFRLGQHEPNILVMFDDDPTAIFGYGVARIPGSMEAESMCRGFSIGTMARLNPDLVVIDEIRTNGEAHAAMRLAECGHLVFASVLSADEEDFKGQWKALFGELQQRNPSFFQNCVTVSWVGKKQPHNTVVRPQ